MSMVCGVFWGHVICMFVHLSFPSTPGFYSKCLMLNWVVVVIRAQELCESGGGRPGLPVPNKPDGFCGHKATVKCVLTDQSSTDHSSLPALGRTDCFDGEGLHYKN